jgi:hypothetical protein
VTSRVLLQRLGILIVVTVPVLFLGPPGLLVGAMAVGLIALDVVSRRQGFEFAHGFLGYRGLQPWPRGVQEDDDFHWRWTPIGDSSHQASPDPTARPDEFAARSQLRPKTRARGG